MTDNQQKVPFSEWQLKQNDLMKTAGEGYESLSDLSKQCIDHSIKHYIQYVTAALSAPAGERDHPLTTENQYEGVAWKLLREIQLFKASSDDAWVTKVLEMIARAFEYRTLLEPVTTTPPTGKAAGVWVKASERMPYTRPYLRIVFRFIHNKDFLYNPESFMNEHPEAIESIEWLDESAQPSETGEGKIDSDFTLWVVVNKWEYDHESHTWFNNYIGEFHGLNVRHDKLYRIFRKEPM